MVISFELNSMLIIYYLKFLLGYVHNTNAYAALFLKFNTGWLISGEPAVIVSRLLICLLHGIFQRLVETSHSIEA